jgi:hypothetical protein
VKPAAIAALALIACGKKGDDTCARLIDHLGDLLGSRPDQRDDAIAACEQQRPPAATIDCAMAATTADAVTKCLGERAPVDEWLPAARRLGEKIGAYYAMHHRFPPSVGPTPAAGSCCRAPGGRCAPDPSAWTGGWRDLGFALDAPSRFSYAFELTDPAAGGVIHAISDLDCDGTIADARARVGLDAHGNLVLTRSPP